MTNVSELVDASRIPSRLTAARRRETITIKVIVSLLLATVRPELLLVLRFVLQLPVTVVSYCELLMIFLSCNKKTFRTTVVGRSHSLFSNYKILYCC